MAYQTAAPDSGDSFYSGTDGGVEGPNPPGSPFEKYPTKVTVPPYNFAKMLGFFGREKYEKAMTERLAMILELPTIIANRNLTQDETDAFIGAQNRRANTACLGDVVMGASVLVGTQYIKQTTNLTDIEVFSRKFRLPSSLMIRGFILLPPMAMIGHFIGESVSHSLSALYLTADRRLRGYHNELRKQNQVELKRRMRAYLIHRSQQEAAKHGRPIPQFPEQGSDSQSYGGMDDMSPTGGSFQSDYGQSYDGQQSADQSRIIAMAQQQQQQQQQYQQQYEQRQQQQQVQRPTDQGESFFEDDNASPVASPASPARPARPSGGWQQQRQQGQQQSGSAWSRVRQSSGIDTKQGPFEQSPEQQQWGQSSEQVPQSNPDRYNTSSRGQDGGQIAQSDRDFAQREFDRMLDQERRLGTGSADGNEQRTGGWRRS